MSPSALTRLAWASLPERAVVGRVANELLRQNIDGGRGEKGDVKDAVRASCPPRGRLTSRVSAVMAELKRQKELQQNRRHNRPYVWARPALMTRRRLVAEARLRTQVTECHDVRVVSGHALYVVTRYKRYSRKKYLAVLHMPTNVVSMVEVGGGEDVTSLAEAVVAMHPQEISRAIQHGGFYTIDVCRMVTTIHPLDAPSFDLHWPIEDEPHPLHRPRQTQCVLSM